MDWLRMDFGALLGWKEGLKTACIQDEKYTVETK